jgi:uncharacterized protein YprB with RNaseH-like and TPR domain/predicted nuclease with RNAse H fold/dephospho-CoA kinase
MLTSTFQHIKGINTHKEAELWRSGILSWDEFEVLPLHGNSQSKLFQIVSVLASSKEALREEDVGFFANALDRQEHYRIALAFPSKTLFLDIETTGLSKYYNQITLVGWCIDQEHHVFISGSQDSALRAALEEAKIVVTFNGSLFDLPFLRDKFEDLLIPLVHVDLRFLAKRVGLVGGQKTIEKILRIKRPSHLLRIEGESAPILWYKYRKGDLDALKLLIEYNHADIEGMKHIFDKVVERLLKKQKVPQQIYSAVPRFAKPTKIMWSSMRKKNGGGSSGIHISPYRGNPGPIVTFDDLQIGPRIVKLRVVGIDLTGSEMRPSGWCLLDGKHAITRGLKCDADIIRETVAAKPHLISIDSPLSLPKGRITVSDNDPGRYQYGIMRYCERALKRRGINVYPALLPSMQKLTARGIHLAQQFRSIGIPVIESYPGAAQDIMNIPRKQAGLQFLREGLAEFGVAGDFLDHVVSHDELDAITAAVVGVFFWSGKFERLGNEDEEDLIIPDIHTDATLWHKNRVIGFSGPLAAGKTTAARYLEAAGFNYGRYSMVIEEILHEKGKELSRQALQQLGTKINKQFGQRWLGRKLLKSLPKTGKLVIDGLRFPEDHALLAEAFGPAFYHIHVEAPEGIRRIRFKERMDEDKSFVEAQAHPVERQVTNLRTMAHATLSNETPLPQFLSAINRLINP